MIERGLPSPWKADGANLKVVCSGPLPDNLAEGIAVLVEGRLDDGGLLHGEKVLTRCASKYQSRLPAVDARHAAEPKAQRRRTIRDDLRPTLPACGLRCLRATRPSPASWAGDANIACCNAPESAPALSAFLALTLVSAILAEALLANDFRFAYVAQYSSRLLPWYYALSAFWVGQAGSLLFWAWSVGVLAMIYRFWPRRTASPLREPAFAILMAYQCFLVAVMVFGADPMQPSLAVPRDGGGLSPLLQHPAMLLHPPVVFLGLCRLRDSLCLGRRGAAERPAGRRLGPRGPAVGFLHLGRAGDRHPRRGLLGLRRTRLGRLLELGPGGERLADPVAHGHRHDSRRDGLPPARRPEADHRCCWPWRPLRPAISPPSLPAAASSAACTPSANRRSAGCFCC